MSDGPVCRHCGAALEPDGRGRFVSCCSTSIPKPQRPIPEHGGGRGVGRLTDEFLDAAGHHPEATRSVIHLVGFVLMLLLMVLCGSGLLVRWLP